ncbi:MAG: methionyl-tRNA formyltransferase [Actinomycetota bacterium]|nr:methionyl-tRNA formyltransferase [Actinomycetota bacterium]
MRTVFFGTPEWAVPSLQALLDSDIEVAGVVTNPDRPAGRGMELRPSPVKRAALAANLDVRQPERARDPALAEWLARTGADAATVVAYGKILPGDLLAVPERGFVNVHFSLLPRYRGAAPIQRAVMDGATMTGVAIMVLTEGMDEGPVLISEPVAIDDDETAGEVGERLARIGGSLLVDALRSYIEGTLEPVPQDDSQATYAPKITNDEARIVWSSEARSIKNLVRGLNPAPGAWTELQGRVVKVHRVRVAAEADPLPPGSLRAGPRRLVVGTADTALELVEVQPAGKPRMGGADFARGLRLPPDARFE